MRRLALPGVLFLAAAVAVSCDDREPTAPGFRQTSAERTLVASSSSFCGNEARVRLLAGQSTEAGAVTVRNDASSLRVTFTTTGTWAMHETHLAAGDARADIPLNSAGNPKIGHFPFRAEHNPAATAYTYTIPLSQLELDAGETAYIAAHAGLGTEGAWGEGTRLRDDQGNWAMFFTYTVQECQQQQSPTAMISAPVSGRAGEPIVFDGSGSTDPQNGPLTYRWDFGDGSLGGGARLAHLFSAAGTFVATLTVTDEAGMSDTETHTISIAAPPLPSGTTTLTGEVTDPTGAPLPYVQVALVGGSLAGMTDADGGVRIPGFPTGVPAVLRLSRSGYADQIVRLELSGSAGEGFFRSSLRPRSAPGTLTDAAVGGTLVGEDGAAVTLPAGALVDASGTVVSGPVQVTITPIDVSGPEIEAFPGAFRGVAMDGATDLLLSFGTAEYTFTQDGRRLQLAPGRTAMIDIPIYTEGAAAGDRVPVWALDETSGVWIQEGTGEVVAVPGSPTGLALRASVGHFSWWNADKFPDGVTNSNVGCGVGGTGVACTVFVTLEGEGARFRGQQSVGPDGEDLAFPRDPNRKIRMRGFRNTQSCLMGGDTIVSGLGGSSVRIVMRCLNFVPDTLVYGSAVKSELPGAGTTKRYYWNGAAGDVVRLDLAPLPDSPVFGSYAVHDPSGAVLHSGTFGSVPTVAFFTLPGSGYHYVRIVTPEYGGGFSIQLQRYPGDAAPVDIAYGADVPGLLRFPVQTDRYRFVSAVGDPIRVQVSAEAGSKLDGPARLHAPDGTVVATGFLPATLEHTAAVAGTYTISVTSGSGSGYGAYRVKLDRARDTGGGGERITYGDTLSGSIDAPLATRSYVFDGVAGDAAKVQVLDVSGSTLLAEVALFGPGGTRITQDTVNFLQSFIRYDGLLAARLPSTGTYTLTVRALSVNDGLGPYRVALTKLPAGTAVPMNTRVLGTLYTAQADRYTFNAAAGEFVRVRAGHRFSNNLDAVVQVQAPDGTVLGKEYFTYLVGSRNRNGIVARNLPQSGEYTVLIHGVTSTETGAYDLSVERFDRVGLNEMTPERTLAAGETARFVVSAPAGASGTVSWNGTVTTGQTAGRLETLREVVLGQATQARGERSFAFDPLPAAGDYLVYVSAATATNGGVTGTLRMVVSNPAP